MIRVDRNAPGAPTEVVVIPADDGTYALSWTAPEQGTASPVVAATTRCATAAPTPTCQTAQRVAAPGGKVNLPSGRYSLRVWLEDGAGNVDPARAATVSIDTATLRSQRVVDTNPPVLLPSGPAPSSRIKVTKARRTGSTLTLSGTIARGASARITAKLGRTRSGNPVVTKRTTPRRGKWSVRLKLPRSLRSTSAMYLTLSYAGESSFRKTTLKRKLARSARPSGNTAVEFSIEAGRR